MSQTDKLHLRAMYCAAPGNLLGYFDLSAAEAWIVAYLANEPNMKRMLQLGAIHEYAACGIFGKPFNEQAPREGITSDQRYVGKRMNHSGNYRTGPFKIAEFINSEGIITVSVADAKRFHTKWLNTYNLYPWWAEIDQKLEMNRTFVTTYGHRRRFWGISGDDLKKEATAYEPQSTVGDHMHGAIHPELGIPGGNLEIYRKIVLPSKGEIRMTNTSHDSVIVEFPAQLRESIVPEIVSYLRRPIIVRGEQFTIPVDGKVGEVWDEERMEKVKLN